MSKLNATAYSVLGFLLDGSKSGWDIAEQMASTIGYFWNVSRSQVYRELRTLEELGFVEAGEPGPRERRDFAITAEGREAFAEWVSREPGPEIFRFPMLLTLWFGDHLASDELEWFSRVHRKRHEKLVEGWRELAETLPEKELESPRGHTLRFALKYGEALLEWYDGLPWLEGGDPVPMRKKRSARGGKGS